MTWEQKSELCSFLNNEQHEQALDLVLQHIDTMDEQAWDMYFSGITLTSDTIAPFIEKHRIIYQKTKEMQSGSLRTAIRMSLYEKLVSEL